MLYTQDYDRTDIRSDNYDVLTFLHPLLKEDMTCVDLGCGTCRKAIRIAPLVKSVDCIDLSEAMLARAATKITEARVENIRLCNADNTVVPLPSHAYDLCTAFLTTWSAPEVHRLLRPGGLFFIETLSADDKFSMKSAFGKDEFGWRGRYMSQDPDERIQYLAHQLTPFFRIHSFETISFETTLSRESLIALLELTPTIRQFSPSSDLHIIEALTPEGSITVTERRLILQAYARPDWRTL